MPTASPCTRLAVPVLLAAVVALSGCSDDDPATINDRPPTVAPTDPSTSAQPTANTVETELSEAQQAYYQAYVTAVGAPDDANLVGALLDLYLPASVERTNVERRMATYADSGIAGRPGPEAYFVVEDIDVQAEPPDGRATVTFCGYDDGVLVDTRQRAPDGSEILVSDDPGSGRSQFTWAQQSGEWKIETTSVLDTWKGENRCPPPGGS